jgi:single-stranded-DNA-specific exonuclease
MRWILRHPEDLEDHGGPEGMPRLVARLLRSRCPAGPEAVRRFLEPSLDGLSDPFLLPGLRAAAERLDHAIKARERIYVFGDYDVDGMTSAALLARFLGGLGGQVRVRIPDRLTEGYGPTTLIIDEARACDAGVVVMVDCGTTAVDVIDYANGHGIDVIVADHHLPEPELPSAFALINPWREDSTYPFRDLAAVGVTTKLAEGISKLRSEQGRAAHEPYPLLDLTAIGSIADGMSLTDENRILVRAGLTLIRERPRPALRALIDSAGLDGPRISSMDVAFQIVPRLNAAGRMGDAGTALEMLMSEDVERCRFLAAVLDRHNLERRRLLDLVVGEATTMARPAVEQGEPIVLASANWHPGVLGIAASRLAERFALPAILLSVEEGIARGSGRTFGEIDLLDLVRSQAGELRTFGGHRAAVGLSVAVDRLESVRQGIVGRARQALSTLAGEERGLHVDARGALADVTPELMAWMDRLGPFGAGNPEPLLAFHGRVAGGVRVLKARHLRFDFTDGRTRHECIGFDLADRARDLGNAREEIHVAARVTWNTYRGESRLQLQLRDLSVDDPFRIG